MKAQITLEKGSAGYFKSRDQFTPEQWEAHLRLIAERTLAKNGWKVAEVSVENVDI